ncbi:glycoside hydrolase family 3 N-terminal domain-containing protein [Thermocoleostomius sinensis]|uniref:beta-N-acetylhexosaminidase n=1 Tax=Thermocoleostomius sinensis A174 TaxID=2016057 RepID=A0A9E9CA34_9CYAN|nr:glycoside hydrolase family 3 N-terminal domain-containing protein [Thermocoleostomius sinensis]WAL58445.1 beta-glucosidase [Thermocoleostomius sinensis A174]
MVVVRASGHLFDQQIEYPIWEPPAEVLQRWVQELGVGGVILLGGSTVEVKWRTQQLQAWATVPLLIAADIEEGVGQRFAGATWFPPPLALNAIAPVNFDRASQYAERMGAAIAQEALAIGINWVLAPVVDVNNNPANPVINVRAFGETAATVSQLTTAFIRGAQPYPVLTTAKHFPGHGDTAIDSHLEMPILPHSRSRLAKLEWVPFQAAIAAGVDAIITAHVQLPALDDTYPATFSSAILTEELRQMLGFEGLIVTDALMMGAIANRYGTTEAPILAVEAGADIVLMPVDPAAAIAAICQAVTSGRIPLSRIHASLARIWRSKQAVCSPPIIENAASAIHPLIESLTPKAEAIATATAIVRESLQVHQPLDRIHPLQASMSEASRPSRNLILVDDALNSAFLAKQVPAITYPKHCGYELQLVDCHTPSFHPSMLPVEQLTQPTLLQLFVRGTPFRGTSELIQLAYSWVQTLVQRDSLQALVMYGSPYVLESLVSLLPANIPYVFSYGQMPLAQSIALETLFAISPMSSSDKQTSDRRFTD